MFTLSSIINDYICLYVEAFGAYQITSTSAENGQLLTINDAIVSN